MSQRVWTREAIVAEIHHAARTGRELCYSKMEQYHPALVRASERIFGHWGAAVEAAGYDYASIRRYRQWTPARVIEQIRRWHAEGADLSWYHVSEVLDPPLAAAAIRANNFHSWEAALAAAGLEPEQIYRYKKWSTERILTEMEKLAGQGCTLSHQALEEESPALLAAVYHRHRGPGGLRALRSTVSHRVRPRGKND